MYPKRSEIHKKQNMVEKTGSYLLKKSKGKWVMAAVATGITFGLVGNSSLSQTYINTVAAQVLTHIKGTSFENKDIIIEEDLVIKESNAALEKITSKWVENNVEEVRKEIIRQQELGLEVYVIQWGDTLKVIADAIGSNVEELAKINNISDHNFILTGDLLDGVNNNDVKLTETSISNKQDAKLFTAIPTDEVINNMFIPNVDVEIPVDIVEIIPDDSNTIIDKIDPVDMSGSEPEEDLKPIDQPLPSEPINPIHPVKPSDPVSPEEPVVVPIPAPGAPSEEDVTGGGEGDPIIVEEEENGEDITGTIPDNVPQRDGQTTTEFVDGEVIIVEEEITTEPIIEIVEETVEVVDPVTGEKTIEIIEKEIVTPGETTIVEKEVQTENRIETTIIHHGIQYIADESLPAGEQLVVQEGIDGYRSITYNHNDEIVAEELVAATDQIVHVGVKPTTKTVIQNVITPLYYQTITRSDNQLAKGETKVVQEGVNGQRTEVITIVLDNEGNEISRTTELIEEIEPINEIVNVGIGVEGIQRETLYETIPYQTEYIDNDQLLIGETNVIQIGVNGEKMLITETPTVDGIISGETVIISTEITKQPINEVIERGTKVAGPEITTKEVVEEESRGEIPEERVANSDLLEGEERIVNEGSQAIYSVTYQVTYEDGVEVSRTEISATEITPAVTRIVEYGTKVAGPEITTKEVVEEESRGEIPEERVANSDLLEGEERVVNEGSQAIYSVTYQVTYEDGVEVSRTEISATELTPAVTRIVEYGTKKAEPEKITEKVTEREERGEIVVEYQVNPELAQGTEKVVSEGSLAVYEVDYEITKVAGEEVERVKIDEVLVEEAKPKVIEIGTKFNGDDPNADFDGDGIPDIVDPNPTVHDNGVVILQDARIAKGEYNIDKNYYYIGTGTYSGTYIPNVMEPQILDLGQTIDIDSTLRGITQKTVDHLSKDRSEMELAGIVVNTTHNVNMQEIGSYEIKHIITYPDTTTSEAIVYITIKDPAAPQSVLYGKNWTLLGDSITDPDYNGTFYKYDEIIRDNTGVLINNLAIQGANVSTDKGKEQVYNEYNSVINQAQRIVNNPDIITIYAGINDFLHEVPVGSSVDLVSTTFYGALNSMLSGLKATHPKAYIVFIKPTGVFNNAYGNMVDDAEIYNQYMEAIEDTTRANGIYLHDSEVSFKLNDDNSRIGNYGTHYKYYKDNLHLNNEGYAILARELQTLLEMYFLES